MAEGESSEIQSVLCEAGLNSGENGELIGGTGYDVCVNERELETQHEQEHTFLPDGRLLAQQEIGGMATNFEKPRLRRTKKGYLRWKPELHPHFVDACTQLGGLGGATPTAILALMDIKGLTRGHVKSHLQKERQKERLKESKGKEWLGPQNGTGTGIPADAAPPRTITGPSAEIPPFYYNQPNYDPTYNPLGAVNSYACFQEQPQISVQSAPGGFFANSYPKNFLFGNDINAQLPSSYPENFLFRNDTPMQSSSSYPESFLPRNGTNGQPTSLNPANFPSPASGGSGFWTEEYEEIDSLLNFDPARGALNEDASFDYTNVNGFPSQP